MDSYLEDLSVEDTQHPINGIVGVFCQAHEDLDCYDFPAGEIVLA